jgi:indoleacetamide hydrolase
MRTAKKRGAQSASSTELHELGLLGAARAIRNGEVSSETYVCTLLERARAHAGLKAFITIDEASVLQAARHADRLLRAGHIGSLLGVPVAVKDSYLTKGITTTFGTSVLADFTPMRDAVAVAQLKEAGAIVFGKNNLVEMSYGLTGLNEHYGQVKNPYSDAHVTGGSSSGAGASVAGRLVPAALGGDTVGSIRVPASLCGVVGYKPTPGRWPNEGVAPISHTLDTTGVLARSVEDCGLVDAVITKGPFPVPTDVGDLKGMTLAYSPQQHLVEVDDQVERRFTEALSELEDAGAKLVEVDLGADFHSLSAQTTWPLFFHETLPTLRDFLAASHVPISVERIHAALGEHVKRTWTRSVIPSSAGYVSYETYWTALRADRRELRRRYSSTVFSKADALLFPTTPCPAPLIEAQWRFCVRGKEVEDVFLSRNTHPSSSAGLPGVTLPMGLNSEGLPLGLELDAAEGRDRDLLTLACAVEAVLNRVPAPRGF